MAFYTIEFTVTEHAVTPDTPQAAGHTGDHRAVLLNFAVPFEDCRYRLEIVDGCGGYDTTGLLDVVDGTVTYEIPSAWTAAGVAAVRPVAVEQDEAGEEIVRFHFPPVYLTFADREDGEPLGESLRPAWQETLDEAQFFLATAEQKLENGELNGKDGAKGDKGDAGYTPQKGVDYYTDAEKQELIAELGARDVDQTLNEFSPRAVANKAVTVETTRLFNMISGSTYEIHEQLLATSVRLDDVEMTASSAITGASEAHLRLDAVEEQIGDISAALDGILAIQNALIGGAAE